MMGVFISLDFFLFYVFWEVMLLPMYFLIGMWGGPKRVYAAIKFFLFTLFGAVLMLIAILALYFTCGQTFDMITLMQTAPDALNGVLWWGMSELKVIWILLFVGFAIKVPVFPFHTWLPLAHVEAPTGGSVILAAIMLKMGTYGFVRFSLPITPDASQTLDWLMITLSLIAIVYIAFVALVQKDMKKLIAYSSISHMGFVTLGFFIGFSILRNTGESSGIAMGIEGGLVQMISHGFISGAMFLCVGVLYDRMHSRQIADYGGVVNTMPVFAAFMVLFAMANAGLPGTSGFVGEFMVILSAFKANFWIAFLAATTLIFGAAYTLWMIKRVIFGEVANENVAKLTDINRREFLVLGSLAAVTLLVGLWPAPLLEVMHSSVDHLVQQINASKL